jgi:hypothetical protein
VYAEMRAMPSPTEAQFASDKAQADWQKLADELHAYSVDELVNAYRAFVVLEKVFIERSAAHRLKRDEVMALEAEREAESKALAQVEHDKRAGMTLSGMTGRAIVEPA